MKLKWKNLQWKSLSWKKPDWKKPKWTKPSKKALVVSGVSLALVAAIVLGIVFLGGTQEPVGVYPFTMVGMDGYWGDSQESYGPVSTDKIQTVYLSDTQTVTEVLVAQGDAVKKGDVLMSFDTSLSDLQLERKRLEVEKLKLELDAAQADLKTIQALKPMEPMPDFTLSDTTTFQGATLAGSHKSYLVAGHDGKTEETAFICWIQDGGSVQDSLLETLRQEVFQDDGKCQHGNSLATCPTCNCTHQTENKDCEVCTQPRCELHDKIRELCPDCKTCIHGETISQCALCQSGRCVHGIFGEYCSICYPVCVHGKRTSTCDLCGNLCSAHRVPLQYCNSCCPWHDQALPCPKCAENAAAQAAEEAARQATENAVIPPEGQAIAYQGQAYRIQLLTSTESGGEQPAPTTPNSFFVIFKATSNNREMGPQTLWQGAQVQGMGKGFTLRYFTPLTSDYTVPETEDTSITIPDYDPGSGMTATQIAQLRSDQEQKIKELTLKHKMADAEYKIMCKEMGDGHIYAEFDGSVVSILTEQEAKDQKQPILKVSGGGGFFIAGSVSELEKENLKVGQEVTVNDWNTGGVYTGTVKEVGDFPSIDGYWNGAGNPNTTYYPFTVFVGEEASLQAGAYANIQYSTSEAASGIYLEKAFLRTEDGKSYAYVRGADGNLEKRFLTTGKTLWGSYVEIKSGLTVEDYIAFPYGKNVKSRAPTKESDLSELYGY